MWKAPQASAARPSSTSWRAAVDGAGDLGAVLQRAAGDAGDVGLVVLADVGGVGARDRALVAHPGDGDGGVEAAGEGDADALADGQGGQDLAHGVPCGAAASVGAVVTGVRRVSGGVAGQAEESSRERVAAVGVAADHQHGVVAGDGAEHVVELGLVEAEARNCAAPGGVRSTTRLALALGADQQLGAAAGRAGSRRRADSPRRGGRAVAALGGYGVDQRAGGRADLDRVELDAGRATAWPG